jgi:hypothetical protein
LLGDRGSACDGKADEVGWPAANEPNCDDPDEERIALRWLCPQWAIPQRRDLRAAISIITGNTVTYDGTRVKVEFYAPWIGTGTSTNVINIVFLRDSTVLGHAVIWQSGTSSVRFSSPAMFFDTPPAGSHTYAVKAYCDVSTGAFIGAGPGGSGSLFPAFMRVTKA